MCRFRLTSIITDLFLRTGVVRAREITLLEAVETERYQVRTVIVINFYTHIPVLVVYLVCFGFSSF